MNDRDFAPSGPHNVCPVCHRGAAGAEKTGGDCRRRSDGSWFCHTHRGDGCRPGDQAPGGTAFRFVASSDEAQGFGIWKPEHLWDQPRSTALSAAATRRHNSTRRIEHMPAAPLPAAGEIVLARLPEPDAPPPDRWPNGQRLIYSPTQAIEVKVGADGEKQFFFKHCTADGRVQWGAGPDPWPLWAEGSALQWGHGRWIAEAEGEKCAWWLRASGLVAVSQPGCAHNPGHIQPRYQRLQDAGVQGVLYLADNDGKGRERAQQCATAAAAVGLPLLVIHAADVWPALPQGGSIDDAPGAAADRVADLLAAIPAAVERQEREQPATAPKQTTRHRLLSKAELLAFLPDHYRLEYNELTRTCECDGNPLGDVAHLADMFLAARHGIEVAKQAAADCFEYLAKGSPYNPVRRYLLGLRGRPGLRLISMPELAAAFAIEPGDHVSEHLLARHLAGAALRGLNPGHKHDQILILSGDQGTGKSEVIRALASPEWFGSQTRVEDLDDRDFLSKINSCWLFEFEECEHALLKRTAAEFKGFITRRNDSYVEKYEKAAKAHPRRTVLFGTTNQDEFLNDSTGNRRAWVIPTGGRLTCPDWVADSRDSIWATVLTWVDWGLLNYAAHGDQLEADAARRAQDANLSDPWAGAISEVLNGRPVDGADWGIAQDELIQKALHISIDRVDRSVQMRVTRVVTGQGFRTHGGTVAWRSKKRRWSGGEPRAGYMPVPLPPQSDGRGCGDPPVPTGQAPVPSDFGTLETGQTPWNDRRLTDLFQPFQPNEREGIGIKGDDGAGALLGVAPERVATVGTGPQMPVRDRDLGVLTGSERSDFRTDHPTEQLRNSSTTDPLPPSPPMTASSRSELAANAARSNLTRVKPGDRIRAFHPQLAIGTGWCTEVVSVVNASVRFHPAIPAELLLVDPSDPSAGTLSLPGPVSQVSGRDVCLDPDQPFAPPDARLQPRPDPDGGDAPQARWESLNAETLDDFLAAVAEQRRLIDTAPAAA